MFTIERKVKLQWKLTQSVFERINRVPFATDTYPLGAHNGATNTLLSQPHLLSKTLKEIIGSSINNNEWQDKVTEWVHQFHLDIPKNGMEFNIGFRVDLMDNTTKEYIEQLLSSNKTDPRFKGIGDKPDIEKEEIIGKFLAEEVAKRREYREGVKKIEEGCGIVTEENLCNYVTFSNNLQYIQWRYCYLHNWVANKISDIENSPKIKFFLSSEIEDKKHREAVIKVKQSAIRYYNDLVIGDEAVIDNILICAGKVGTWKEFTEMDALGKQELLFEMYELDPAAFLNYKNDTTLTTKANIKKYIWAGLLKTLPNSPIIVDADIENKVIGNSLQEAVAYFNNELNEAYINEIAIKFKKFAS